MKKEIERKVRTCIIEDGLSPKKCLERLEEEYDLDKNEQTTVLEIAEKIGK